MRVMHTLLNLPNMLTASFRVVPVAAAELTCRCCNTLRAVPQAMHVMNKRMTLPNKLTACFPPLFLLLLPNQPCCCCCITLPAVPQAMRVMNKRMNLPNMQKILMEFEKQNERMEMTSDMMGDAIDDAMEVRRL
jgi:hypothetical protein